MPRDSPVTVVAGGWRIGSPSHARRLAARQNPIAPSLQPPLASGEEPHGVRRNLPSPAHGRGVGGEGERAAHPPSSYRTIVTRRPHAVLQNPAPPHPGPLPPRERESLGVGGHLPSPAHGRGAGGEGECREPRPLSPSPLETPTAPPSPRAPTPSYRTAASPHPGPLPPREREPHGVRQEPPLARARERGRG